jgi:hypothetical protein
MENSKPSLNLSNSSSSSNSSFAKPSLSEPSALDKLECNLMNAKIDPSINEKLSNSEQRLQEMQQQFAKYGYVESDEVWQFK